MKLLLRQARKCKTGDPRDRVYAFIGLADPTYDIVPNYKETVAEVFTNAAARILTKEKDFDMIFQAMDNIPLRTPNLPSWVADWSCPQQRRRYLFRVESFSASAGYKGCTGFVFPEAGKGGSFCGRILRIQVRRLDKISVPELFLRVGSEQDREKVAGTLAQWRSRSEKHLGSTEYSALYTWDGGPSDAFRVAIKFGGASVIHEDSILSNPIAVRQQIVTPLNVYKSYMEILKGRELQWSFFATPNGFMGRASPEVRHEDDLFIALGASVPMVLRRVEGRSCYTFVGEACVHSMMNGEAIKMMEKGKLRVEEVDII